jgi:outer membrane protein assembly factor BamD
MSQRLPVSVRSIALVLTILSTALLATGCHNKKKGDELQGAPAEKIYQVGHEAMTHGNWSKAEATFKKLTAQYPYGAYTEQAQMETAYAQYKAGNMEDAVSTIDRYIRTYPTQSNIPYMYYLRGLANSNRDTVFLQKVWKLDASRRDLATPTQAYSDFNLVTDRYADSRYAEDARQRMAQLRDQFARHELDTALYYLRRDAWVSAAGRASYLLQTYPQSEYQFDAIAVLGEAYTRLGNKTLADDARRTLQQNDPQHPWLAGNWPKYPMTIRRLNPFAGEKSPVDNDKRHESAKKKKKKR